MTSWFGIEHGSPEIQARTAGVFASACVVGLIVNLVALFLSAINFTPLQAIMAADDQLFFSLATPPIHNPEKLHRVVLVDIDDEAVPVGNAQAGGSTPRYLIADLIHQIRAENPVAIFVDIDLRNGLDGDKPLRDELGKSHQPPVLIPYFLEGDRADCNDQDSVPLEQRPVLLGSPFRSVSAPDSVVEVHGLMETGAYGLIKGTCSAFLLRSQADAQVEIPAAMVVAAGLAKHQGWPGRLRIVHPLWRIRDKQEAAGTVRNPRWERGGRALYTWIPAKELGFARHDLFNSAIVVLGSSQSGSDDLHYTPVGPMIGSLIHVNLALDLQQHETDLYGWQSTAWQAGFDIILTLLTSAAVTWFCWHPLHLQLGADGRPTLRQGLVRMFKEVGVVTVVFISIAGGILLVARFGGGAGLALWRLALINSLLGAVFVILMEVTFLFGEATQDGVERAVLHRHRPSEATRRE